MRGTLELDVEMWALLLRTRAMKKSKLIRSFSTATVTVILLAGAALSAEALEVDSRNHTQPGDFIFRLTAPG